ncbi:MAG: hypothetical protein B7X86_16015 [Sphingobacteriales bacterium 17-39-43]|uniref:DUF1796 family putative cysteine peptidase n=1 Tax=Daejeonella sp. TaxID=2805397 RepID=UPI000BD5B869|nr:DUF1796 family putative cysteine peptidase [Daejeonella sp.]OYZ28453.1 MAG: hypothetical protein B7Y24_16630 [Sphingobacteriales bacterium 16-39-50]OZA22345.1 MAG: hypothetical protein B7X86_16015 [Sphingobacteriales bacterium 17-39-43]HQS52518.1 DUF1796 family putative cysteine peptidase [Daejeonella sp.]HQT24624.1 DUF1796 family putative cysteine peptidase [Daejeonella sp.]HQT59363.1 DUF1796 family putative cysteine peptidase [Daejeonella sp.]
MFLSYLFHGISNIFHRRKENRIYLSFGENCLTDNILSRYGLKSFTTPFSHCRSNIEYILDLERNNYENFISGEFLKYGDLNGKPVPRLKTDLILKNTYHHLHEIGIEFPSQDVIKNHKYWQRVVKRAIKLKAFLGKRKYILLYHHRVCEGNNLELLLMHLSELKKYYSTEEYECQVVLFKQIIVSKESEKKLIYQKDKDIHIFDFHSHYTWTGRDQRKYWAFIDDSLISKMLKAVKTI